MYFAHEMYKKNAHIQTNVRQVYKGEIEEKLLTQLCTESTVAIIVALKANVNVQGRKYRWFLVEFVLMITKCIKIF